MAKCSCKDRQIFVQKSSNFLRILLVISHNLSTKHTNLQLTQTPVFDKRCYQYTQSMYIVFDKRCYQYIQSMHIVFDKRCYQYTQSMYIVKDLDMFSLFISLMSHCFFCLKNHVPGV